MNVLQPAGLLNCVVELRILTTVVIQVQQSVVCVCVCVCSDNNF